MFQGIEYTNKRFEILSLRGERLDIKQCESLESILKMVQFRCLDLEATHLDDEVSFKKSEEELRKLCLKEGLSFLLTLDYMCQLKCLWFIFIKWMSFEDLFWVPSWLDSLCSSGKWLFPFGFIRENDMFTTEKKSTFYGQLVK